MCTHKQSTSCSWIRGHQRHPVSKQISFELTVAPEGLTQRAPQRRQPLFSISSLMKFPTRSLCFPSGDERLRRAVSVWSLCLVWHVCRNSWPLSSVLTATLVTTGTERLSCHSFVSSGSRITSQLSQDYSSDLLFGKKMNVIRTNAAERSNSLSMLLIC